MSDRYIVTHFFSLMSECVDVIQNTVKLDIGVLGVAEILTQLDIMRAHLAEYEANVNHTAEYCRNCRWFEVSMDPEFGLCQALPTQHSRHSDRQGCALWARRDINE